MYNTSMKFGIPEALVSLRPGAPWTLNGDSYDLLNWLDDSIEKPTQEEIQEEINRLQSEYDYYDYARKRSAEYPNILDYIDGIVKGDQHQIDKYIDECLAVKAKYPKPE